METSIKSHKPKTSDILSPVLFFFAIFGLLYGFMLVVNHHVDIVDSRNSTELLLVAEELDLEPDDIIVSDDSLTYHTEKGTYKADFVINGYEVELRNLIKTSEEE